MVVLLRRKHLQAQPELLRLLPLSGTGCPTGSFPLPFGPLSISHQTAPQSLLFRLLIGQHLCLLPVTKVAPWFLSSHFLHLMVSMFTHHMLAISLIAGI